MALTKVPSNLDAAVSVTQSQSDNSTNVATTAYVDTAISNLSDSAPAALNTLNEIAAALGDDANFAAATTAAIVDKLPLSGGAMTGPITTNSTFDGVDIATRDAILTSTTTTANAALPKAGGTMTGPLTVNVTGSDVDAVTITGDNVADFDFVANPPEFNLEDTSSNSGTKRARITVNDNQLQISGLPDDDQAVSQYLFYGNLNNGNVGIGIDTPYAQLQVLDELKISNANQSSGKLVLGDGSSTNFNVGIARWNGTSNAAGAGGLGYFSQGTANSGGHYFYNGDAVAGSTTEVMRINPDGMTEMSATKAYGSDLGLLRIRPSFTGTNYSAGAKINLVFGHETTANSYIGELRVTQSDPSVSTASTMGFYTNSGGGNSATTARMTISSAGNVGIGTDSPSTMLHLSAGTTGSAGGSHAGITMTNKYDNPDNSWSIKPAIDSVSNTGLEIRDVTDNRSVMVFDGSGNVGIGLASPIDSKLVIVETPATIVGGNAISGSTMKGLKLRTNLNSDESVGVWFGTNGSHWSGISGQRKNAASTWGTDLRFYTHEDAVADLTYARERMIIDSEGKVGIGTNSPSQFLDVRGHTQIGDGGGAVLLNFNATGNAQLKFGNNEWLRHSSSGTTAIGNIAAPNFQGDEAVLEVYNDTGSHDSHLYMRDVSSQTATGRQFSVIEGGIYLNGSGDQIKIPYGLQSGSWRKHLIIFDFVGVMYNNSSNGYIGGGKIAMSTLSTSHGASTLHQNYGMVTSVTHSPSTGQVFINLSSSIPTGLSNGNGIFMSYKILSETADGNFIDINSTILV